MSTAATALPVSPRHPLRNPFYRLLWMANTLSWFGDQFYLIALPWLILQITGSSTVLGTVMMAAAVPRAVFMLIGGAATDRISPRQIMAATALARALLVGGVGFLIWQHSASIWALYVLAFFFGTADAFYAPASQVFLPSIVPSEELPAANAMSQGTIQVVTMIAPAPAALVVKSLGAAAAFFIDAVSFLFLVAALRVLPDTAKPSQKKRGAISTSIVEGLTFVKEETALRSLLLVATVMNFSIAGPMSIGLAWMAKEQFHSPIAFGIFTSALAAGSLAGLTLSGMRKQKKRGRLFLGISALIGACLVVVGQLHELWYLAAVLFIMAAAAAFLNVQLLSWFQQRVDRSVLGRVMSVVMFASVGLLPFSLVIAGVAIRWSLSGMFAIAGAMMLGVTLIASKYATVRHID